MSLDTLPIYSPTLEEILDRPVLLVSPHLSVLEVLQQMYPQVYAGDTPAPTSPPIHQTRSKSSSYVLISTSPEAPNPPLLGIFTERDAVALVAQGANLAQLTLQQVMTTPVHTLRQQDYQDIFSVITYLRQYQIRHLPVINHNGSVIGVITLKSLRQKLTPLNLLRLRTVSEIMSTELIQAGPQTPVQELAQLMNQHQVSCVIITTASTNGSPPTPIGIVTEQDIVQLQLQNPHWQQADASSVMSAPLFTISASDHLFNAHQIMLRVSIRRLIVIGTQGELQGIITERDLLQILNAVELYGIIESLQQQVQEKTAQVRNLEAEKVKILQDYNTNLSQQLQAQTQELQNQVQVARLLATIAHRIRQSLDLTTILQTTVAEVRQFLQCDRVFLYQFQPDWSGVVVAESVTAESESLLERNIYDPCFFPDHIQPYLQGQIRVLVDRETAPLSPCHQELLATLQIRSQLIVPILEQRADESQTPYLWGLLIASEGSNPRHWQTLEIQLLENLATQISIAIQQSTLFTQAQTELRERQRAEAEIRRLNAELEARVEERTAQLATTNQALQQRIHDCTLLEKQLQHSDWQMREIFRAMMDLILVIDADINTITVAPTYPVLFAHPQWDIVSATIERLVEPETATAFAQAIEEALICQTTVTVEYTLPQGSSQLWFMATLHPLSSESVIWVACDITTQKRAEQALQLARTQLIEQVEERTEALERANLILIQEVQERQQAEAELRNRSSQQAAIAELGQQALAKGDITSLLELAVTLVMQVLKVDYCAVLEALPDQSGLRLVAGRGWRPAFINQVIVGAGEASQGGYTLKLGVPVILADLKTETRFQDVFLRQCGRVTSGVSVIIAGQHQPFGVLAIHTKELCEFGDSDISFLQVIANVIATALERWQAEEELNHFFDLSLDMLSLLEVSGQFKRINPRFATTLGYPEQQMLASSWIDFVHSQDRVATEAALEKLGAGTPIFDLENRYRCANGNYRWLAWTAMPSATDQMIYSVARDITERKLAEATLRDSEELHRVVLSSISDAVFITDSQGGFTFICPNVSHIFGYTKPEIQALNNIQELLGLSFWETASEKTNPEITNLEQEITDKFGIKHLLLVNIKQVEIKTGRLLYCCRDITTRKQVEIALAKRERYLSALVTIQHRLLSVNRHDIIDQTLLKLLGEAAEASRVFLFKNHWHTDGTLWGIKQLEWCAPGVNPTVALQKKIPMQLLFPQLMDHWKTGYPLTHHVTNFAEIQQYFDQGFAFHSLITLPLLVQGQFYGFIGLSDGVLERKWESSEIDLLNSGAAAISLALERQQAETALKTLNQELENIIDERTHELKQTNDQLLIEIIERQQIETELQEKAKQQAMVSELGKAALSGTDLHHLTHQVVALITEVLQVEYCKVLITSGESFLVLGIKTLAEFINLEFNIIEKEINLDILSILPEPQRYQSELINGVTLTIQGQTSPLGYLGIYSHQPKILSSEDIACLQSIASILSMTIERKQSEEKLKASLKEKELLLKEIHHRVKNNLLVVSNLLEFQADYTQDTDTLEILSDCQHRISSMALIHEKLYRSTNLDRINFGEYLEALVDNLFESYHRANDQIQLILEIEPVILNVETANPCGLIINELLLNILKHAFPQGRRGIIHLSLSENEQHQITLRIEDNGVGFPPHLDFRKTESLGMELVCTLTEQIKGTLEMMSPTQGTAFRLTFSELEYRKRW